MLWHVSGHKRETHQLKGVDTESKVASRVKYICNQFFRKGADEGRMHAHLRRVLKNETLREHQENDSWVRQPVSGTGPNGPTNFVSL
jgi:hypothetical protein